MDEDLEPLEEKFRDMPTLSNVEDKHNFWDDDEANWPDEYPDEYPDDAEPRDPLERFRPAITSMDLSPLPSDVLAYLLSWVDDAPVRQVCKRWRELYPKREHSVKHYVHRVELLQWAFDSKCPKNIAVSMEIVRFGNLIILKWAFKQGCHVNQVTSITAAEIGSLKTLKWIASIGRVDIGTVFMVAVHKVHLPIIKWALLLGHKPDEDADAVPAAVQIGHFPLVRWLVNKGCPYSGEILHKAVMTGDLNILSYLCERTECTEEQEFQCVAEAVNRGKVEVFDWLIAHDFECDWKSYTVAAIRNNISMLRRLYKEDAPWDITVCAGAVKAGTAKSLETLRWLRQNDAPWDPLTFAEAARSGNMEILEWLRNNGCPWDASACAGAARSGNLEVLKWLRQHGCPWNKHTCIEAVRRGHLDVLKWAIEAGCPVSKRVFIRSVAPGLKDIYLYLRSIGWNHPIEIEVGDRWVKVGWPGGVCEKDSCLEDVIDHLIFLGELT